MLSNLFNSSLKDDLFRRLFKNAGILLSGNIGASMLGLISLALTARALGAESFGILVLISTYVLVIDRLINFQSWQAIIKYGAEALEQPDHDEFKSLLKFGFILDIGTAFAGTLIAASGASFVGHWQGWNPDTVLMATLYSATILFHISGVPTAILRLFDRYKLFSLIAVIAAAIKLLGITTAYLNDAGLWAFLIIWAFTDILGKILLLIMTWHELKRRSYLPLHQVSIGQITARFPGIWGFVISTNLNTSIRMTSREADVLVIGALLTPTDVGLYKIAKQVASILGTLADPLYQSIYPEFARLRAKKDNQNLIKLSIRSSALAGAIALLIWGLLLLVAEPLLYYIFGSQYVPAQLVMIWYVSALVIAVAGFPLTPIMLALGKPNVALWNYIISTLFYFWILLSLLDKFGIVGAGIAYVSFYIVWTSVTLFYVVKFLREAI